jgi:hypothetical protein
MEDLTRLTRVVGPLFIVLEDAGRGFEDPRGELASRKLFMAFTRIVLKAWLETPMVYFVILGHSTFLHSVGERPQGQTGMDPSPLKFLRLPLKLLRPPEIEVILRETRSRSTESETLQQRWGLESDEGLEKAAQLLFAASSGRPRVILELLQNHPTFPGFQQYVETRQGLKLSLKDWDEVFRNVVLWQDTLVNWIRDGNDGRPTVNLFGTVKDAGGRDAQAALVLDRYHLRWEGTMDRARVVAHEAIENVVSGILSPHSAGKGTAFDVGRPSGASAMDVSQANEGALLRANDAKEGSTAIFRQHRVL